MLVYTNATALIAITILALTLSLYARARVPSVVLSPILIPRTLDVDGPVPAALAQQPKSAVSATVSGPVLGLASTVDDYRLIAVSSPVQESGIEAFRKALVASPWPVRLHHALTEIARCESQFNRLALGDAEQSKGWLQIHTGWHPELDAEYDLFHGPSNLIAGWIIYQRAGLSFRPWSCWDSR